MKKILLMAACTGIGFLSIAQNGKLINDKNAQSRDVRGFHAVRISGGIDLYLSQGPEAVAVSASRNEYRDQIQTVVENGVLKIYLQNTGSHMIWGFSSPKLKAYVSATTLDELKASGGSDVSLEGLIKTDKLGIHLSGGSDLKGKVDIRDLSIDQSGGSDVDISGTVTNLTVDASGGSDLKGYDLAAETCTIEASGGSDAEITVNKTLNAHASGGSDIYYKGSGVISQVRSSGSGSVKKRS
ncbi:MAG TPA: head GIN domain-containing protein [Puia sp.]|nr:head GIN domain-containing protein [Puia sp.]